MRPPYRVVRHPLPRTLTGLKTLPTEGQYLGRSSLKKSFSIPDSGSSLHHVVQPRLVGPNKDRQASCPKRLSPSVTPISITPFGKKLSQENYIKLPPGWWCHLQAGGGFVGVHSASDTEYDWPWYGQLVGAYFDGHPTDPSVRTGTLLVVQPDHPSTVSLPTTWTRSDEWYDLRDLQAGKTNCASSWRYGNIIHSRWQERWQQARQAHLHPSATSSLTLCGTTTEGAGLSCGGASRLLAPLGGRV